MLPMQDGEPTLGGAPRLQVKRECLATNFERRTRRGVPCADRGS
jgi:hypothetical protein